MVGQYYSDHRLTSNRKQNAFDTKLLSFDHGFCIHVFSLLCDQLLGGSCGRLAKFHLLNCRDVMICEAVYVCSTNYCVIVQRQISYSSCVYTSIGMDSVHKSEVDGSRTERVSLLRASDYDSQRVAKMIIFLKKVATGSNKPESMIQCVPSETD